MVYRIGVDIGGTSVKTGVVDECFAVVEETRIKTGAFRGSEAIVSDIIDECKRFCGKYEIASVGIGSAGTIDPKRGMVISAGNLPFANEPIAVKLSQVLDIPAAIDNDGTCALIGEKAAGACRSCDDALIITIGTGIGGAIMTGGRIYRGHNNRAGELGHFIVDMHGEECECGLHGCYEQYASATALKNMTKQYAEANPTSLLYAECEKGIDGRTAFNAAKAGDETALLLLKEYAGNISLGINSFVRIFQPEMIVLAGGIANEGSYLTDLISPFLLKEAVVRTTELHGYCGLIGASLLGTKHHI